jgi:ribosome-associated toxin RatA of RatAB toxin-antitoxin module
LPKVENSIQIKGQLAQVYALAKDIYSFPEFIPDVRNVKIVEGSTDGGRIVSEWEGIVNEFNKVVFWTGEEIWDDQASTCNFSLLSGDHGRYSGMWTLTDMGDSVRFDSEIDVQCDIPLIKGFIAKRVRVNMDSMLGAIKAKIEG